MKKVKNYSFSKQLEIIRDFAQKMGYEVFEEEYKVYGTNKKAYSIELLGKNDIEGDPYCWAWYVDTGEPL